MLGYAQLVDFVYTFYYNVGDLDNQIPMEYATVEKLLCAQYPEMVMRPELKFYAETQLLLPKNATPDILQPLEEWMEKVAPTLDGDPTALHDDEAHYIQTMAEPGETVIKALTYAFNYCQEHGIRIYGHVGHEGTEWEDFITIQQEDYNKKYSFTEGYDYL